MCSTQGEDLMFQWYKNDAALPGPDAQNPTYTIRGPAVSDSGRYHCIVSNAAGTATTIQAVVHVARRRRTAQSSSGGDFSASASLAAPLADTFPTGRGRISVVKPIAEDADEVAGS